MEYYNSKWNTRKIEIKRFLHLKREFCGIFSIILIISTIYLRDTLNNQITGSLMLITISHEVLRILALEYILIKGINTELNILILARFKSYYNI